VSEIICPTATLVVNPLIIWPLKVIVGMTITGASALTCGVDGHVGRKPTGAQIWPRLQAECQLAGTPA